MEKYKEEIENNLENMDNDKKKEITFFEVLENFNVIGFLFGTAIGIGIKDTIVDISKNIIYPIVHNYFNGNSIGKEYKSDFIKIILNFIIFFIVMYILYLFFLLPLYGDRMKKKKKSDINAKKNDSYNTLLLYKILEEQKKLNKKISCDVKLIEKII